MGHAAVKHDYHLVDPSPWPFVTSVAMFVLAVGAVIFMKGFVGDPLDSVRSFFADEAAARAAMAGGWDAIAAAAASNAGWQGMDEATRSALQASYETNNAWYWLLGKHQPWVLIFGFAFVTYCAAAWWRDVIKESKAGFHTPVVGIGLRYGMILFIASEVMFFVAWFWMFFEGALFPEARVVGTIPEVAEAWATWPPKGVETLDPWHLPLINTMILLLSGTTVTWAHHALQEGNRKHAEWGLMATVALGVIFTCIQAYEYHHILHSEYFNFGGSEYGYYGSTFFMATGFHGAHVLIGTIFLIVCLVRLMRGGFTPQKHFGFEAAAWYWHFVDVVWLFLFAFVYVTFGG